MKEGIERHIQSRTDEQLYTILFLDDPENWQPEALEAARAEWERRGLSGERIASLKQAAEEQRQVCDDKANEPLFGGACVFFFFVNFLCCMGVIGLTLANVWYRQHGYHRKFRESLFWMVIGTIMFGGLTLFDIIMTRGE